MPTVPTTDSAVSTLGLFALELTVPDALNAGHPRVIYQAQVGVDLTNAQLDDGRPWFGRAPASPVAQGFKRKVWGHAAQSAVASAMVEGWQEDNAAQQDLEPIGGGAHTPVAAEILSRALHERLQGAEVRTQELSLEDDLHVVHLRSRLSATALLGLGGPGGSVVQDPLFQHALHRAVDAAGAEITDLLGETLGVQKVLFSQTLHAGMEDDGLARLQERHREQRAFEAWVRNDAREVREAVQQAWADVPRAPQNARP